MVTAVLTGEEVMDVAASLAAASGDRHKAIKSLLKKAEALCQTEGATDLLRLIRMKLTQMEDQNDGP